MKLSFFTWPNDSRYWIQIISLFRLLICTELSSWKNLWLMLTKRWNALHALIPATLRILEIHILFIPFGLSLIQDWDIHATNIPHLLLPAFRPNFNSRMLVARWNMHLYSLLIYFLSTCLRILTLPWAIWHCLPSDLRLWQSVLFLNLLLHGFCMRQLQLLALSFLNFIVNEQMIWNRIVICFPLLVHTWIRWSFAAV